MLKNRKNIFLGFICLTLLLAVLMAGLWPFSFFPKNKVAWLPDKNGISFYGRGMVYNHTPFDDSKQTLFENDSISIEIWLQPREEPVKNIAHILSLFGDKETALFSIGQWKSELIIRSIRTNSNKGKLYKEIYLDDILTAKNKVFITITSNSKETAVYLNGKPIKLFPYHSLNAKNRSDSLQLLLGNSKTGFNPWGGMLLGLAIYNSRLSESGVLHSYESWLKKGTPSETDDKKPYFYYLFNERSGSLVRNGAEQQFHLYKPDSFRVLKKSVLVPPWRYFRLNRSHLRDIFVNIIGFMPIGFFFSAFLYNPRRPSIYRLYFVVMITGGIVSLAIELLQVYLPMRHSSLTDLLCNISGTLLGILLFHAAVLKNNPLKRLLNGTAV